MAGGVGPPVLAVRTGEVVDLLYRVQVSHGSVDQVEVPPTRFVHREGERSRLGFDPIAVLEILAYGSQAGTYK